MRISRHLLIFSIKASAGPSKPIFVFIWCKVRAMLCEGKLDPECPNLAEWPSVQRNKAPPADQLSFLVLRVCASLAASVLHCRMKTRVVVSGCAVEHDKAFFCISQIWWTKIY